jgi:hypothetical protein
MYLPTSGLLLPRAGVPPARGADGCLFLQSRETCVSVAEGLDRVVNEALVRDLARKLLRETAPEELPLLRPASERYFADPEKALRKRRQEQEVLGFGGEAVVALLTPIVLTVATDVLSHFATELAKDAGSRGAGPIRAALRRLFRLEPADPGTAAAEVPPITPEQLLLVRRSAFDRAVALDLPESKANVLADALVGSLAKSKP